jgi:hypothetical protein
MTEQEVIVPGVGSLYAPEGAIVPVTEVDSSIGGREHLDPRDYGPLGAWKIVNQPNHPFEGVTVGTVVHTRMMTEYKEVTFVGLEFLRKTRVWWPEDMDVDNDPICYSNDFMVPAEPSEFRPMTERQDGPCATCPMSQWETAEDGSRLSPLCNEQMNFLIAAIDPEIRQIIEGRLTLKRSMIPDARQLVELMNKIELRGTIRMNLYLHKNDRGMQWYKPTFTPGRALDQNAISHFSILRKNLLERIESGEIPVGADLGDIPLEGEVVITDTPEDKPKKKAVKKKPTRRTRRPPEPEPPQPEDDEIPF